MWGEGFPVMAASPEHDISQFCSCASLSQAVQSQDPGPGGPPFSAVVAGGMLVLAQGRVLAVGSSMGKMAQTARDGIWAWDDEDTVLRSA